MGSYLESVTILAWGVELRLDYTARMSTSTELLQAKLYLSANARHDEIEFGVRPRWRLAASGRWA